MRHPRAFVPIGLAMLALFATLAASAPHAQTPVPPFAVAQATAPPLSIGLSESDPRLLIARGPTKRASTKAVALKPNYVRVLVPWERIQPRAGHKPNWDAPPGGCPKLAPRCKSALGMRALLTAIRQRQMTDGGWKILAVPFFTPGWAVSGPPTGCQKLRHRHTRSQMPRISAYRRFLRALNALADKVGVKIDYISPWNEPNHPAFLQPQRAQCRVTSKAIAPRAYARLVRAAKRELRFDQALVLGSLAGLVKPRVYGAGAAEFIRGMPHDVACAIGPFAQHAYVGEPGRRGRPPVAADPETASRFGLLDGVIAALDAKECPDIKALWIAETGTFDHRCEAMFAALRSWAINDRVDAAFQYTFRESRDYPVGLVSPSMFDTYRSYRAWRAFAGGPQQVPDDPC